jgi:hypothetical protein
MGINAFVRYRSGRIRPQRRANHYKPMCHGTYPLLQLVLVALTDQVHGVYFQQVVLSLGHLVRMVLFAILRLPAAAALHSKQT